MDQWTCEPVKNWISEPVNYSQPDQIQWNRWTSEPDEPVNYYSANEPVMIEPDE